MEAERKNIQSAPLYKEEGLGRMEENSEDLSPEEVKYCQEECKKLSMGLHEYTANIFANSYVLNLSEAEKTGSLTVGRLTMNRKPKEKSINKLAQTIQKDGLQIMLLVIPATVAVHFGYSVEDFDGESITEDKLERTVVIMDGQTRYSAIKKIKSSDDATLVQPDVYAYFPLNWISLGKMLQSINLKVFTWSNSDFMTGVLGNVNIGDKVKVVLKYIQMLESRGYNYTSACEWVTLTKGIVRKAPLVKAMSEANPKLDYSYSDFGMEIHKAVQKKFSDAYEDALKNKTIPELIIDKWNAACRKLSQEDATKHIIRFIERIGNDELKEMVAPSQYKRGCGKKKEVYVKKQFEESYQAFLRLNPLKSNQNEEEL